MLNTYDFSLPKTLNPSLSCHQWVALKRLSLSLSTTLTPTRIPSPIKSTNFPIQAITSISQRNAPHRRNARAFAGRSKKKPGGPSTGRIEGNAELRREAKKNARRKSKRLAENLFYRLKNPNRNQADSFSEEELQMIGLGYDRMVRFMEKDDPNLRHPYDWYKYGEFGPYSWRGIVVGDPIRGRFSDECVSLIGEVRDHEEWEKIEQFEMATDFTRRLKSMDRTVGFRYFWVFVRHPKWRITELPWQQWTLVSEVVLEAGNQRLDKWTLMSRLGNKARALITQCAAWMRPDIIYVKRPVYQCRFEPQIDFFKALMPLLDPDTEQDYLFELRHEDGRVELCTYFGGLCKIVKVNPKAFVDDVVKGYEKLSDEGKSKCLEFLLSNHPIELLHPYTREWKAKLEEMELGCDAPDEDDDNVHETEITDWIEEEEEEEEGDDDDDDDSGEYDNSGSGDEDYDDDRDDIVMDMEDGNHDEELGIREEALSAEETEKYWDEKFNKALGSSEEMESLVKQSVEASTAFYKRQLKTMENEAKEMSGKEGGENVRLGRAKVSEEEWKYVGYGPRRRRIKKSTMPPELFLRAAVRPFTYRNLVKEIVLTRHAIIEGEIGRKD
ncbi:PREDICTED: uncharacterized protein LOC104611736 [Nelumbo nucifera]|uniref:Uncharacterized protein LOC104611736 n=1 Tax=Nelumbo nucifera TaxID=4432 RepID=A0A1U8BJG2_NELNU|nr:PREDICTED: uncharacterized protein LOC104611736 [Nelumbo nucifera]